MCTIAFGMGVNCSDIMGCIHFGPSNSIESYVQESGRIGRNGERSIRIFFFLTICCCEIVTKEFIYSSVCRRSFINKIFGFSNDEGITGCSCCDICSIN